MERDTELLSKVSEIFLQNGAKTVTMDEIAKELRISKKTLYEKYRNKDLLLEAVLSHNLETVLKKINDLDKTIDNAVERMMARDREIEKSSRTNESIFLRQLIKYYPQIFNKHMLFFSEKLSDILINNIKRGRSQGLYREDFDAQLYSKLFFQMTMSFDNSPYLNTNEISRSIYQQGALSLYMNAITTEKGKETMRNLEKR